MPDAAHLILAFCLAFGAAFAVTPLAISVASRADFHDAPVGYKGHKEPTPYLGGTAVLGGFLIAALSFGGVAKLTPIVLGTCALWLLGTVDDKLGLPAWPRLLVEASVAIALWATGLGWDILPGDAPDLVLTIVWVVGLVNSFNLIDNMDGAAATLAAVSGATVGTLALIEGDPALGVLAFGLAGACLGFLPYNLAAPARIFLGDGGSLPLGFVVAASLMALPHDGGQGTEWLLAAVLLAGLPVVDTALVMVSRHRAGVSFLTGGRDHLTHRLLTRLRTPRNVALALGAIQLAMGAVAIGVIQLGHSSVLVAGALWFMAATASVVLLETASWAPVREPAAAPLPHGVRVPGTWRRSTPSLLEALLIAFISISCGLSPFLYGFYDVSVWGPIALGMLAALLGLLIARPAVPRRTAVVAIVALAGYWLWALASVGWAESANQAITDANRMLLYAALFGVLVLLLRDDRLGTILIAAGTAAIAALGGYLIVRMLSGSAPQLFLAGRLHKPLGYANGQAGYLLLGVWPLIAVAERMRNPLAAGAGMAGAVALAGLVLLTQTRAVAPAVLVSAAVTLAVVPGRVRRGWALVVLLGGVLVCLGPVLDVYQSVRPGRPPGEGVLRSAATAILLASALAGVVWAAATAGVSGLADRVPAARHLAATGLIAVVVAGAVVGLSAVDRPVERVRTQYRAFTQLDPSTGSGSRFTAGAGNRYDYWRVAWGQFRSEPFHGIGAGNYDRTYFADRRTSEDVRQAHSIELQTLGELGIVGGALLLAFVGAILTGFLRRARAGREDPRERGLAVAAGGAFLVWLAHTSVDWLHLIPGLTGLALCAAAVLVGPWRRPRASLRGAGRVALIAVAGVAIAIGVVLVGRTAVAQHYREQGQQLVATHPAAAIAKARDSLALDDEPLATYYLESAAWARLGSYPNARAALELAVRREPHDFVPHALLGDLATRRGDYAQALRDYRAAALLNPRDRSLQAAVAQARKRRQAGS